MADYTIELGELIDSGFELGLDEYPIFDEDYRSVLYQKIINYYFYHEIGVEDNLRFKRRLNDTLDLIMPMYNKMYESTLLELSPLLSYSRTETATDNHAITSSSESSGSNSTTSTNSVTGSGTSTSENTHVLNKEETGVTENETNNSVKVTGKNIESETPQGLLTIGDIEDSVYASKAGIKDDSQIDSGTLASNTNNDTLETGTENRENNTTQVTNGTSSNTATNSSTASENKSDILNHSLTANGYDIPLSELLMLYRKTFVNVDKMVIDELRQLFMLVF